MSQYHYQAEFASGYRADLTVSKGGISISWTPDVPRLKGEALQRFLAAYRTWRDESLADFGRRSGIKVSVAEI